MRLSKTNLEDDTYTYVDVKFKDLHPFAEIEGDNGGAFHVVPEAVLLPEGKIRVCQACAHTCGKTNQRGAVPLTMTSPLTRSTTLYSKNAPNGSIAGDDYGRLSII